MDEHKHSQGRESQPLVYTCPMHPEVRASSPGNCPKCGMKLVRVSETDEGTMHHGGGHQMKPPSQMSRREKFKMSMTMSMGMEHTGIAGREMARLMELDMRQKFFFALLLSIPIFLYSRYKAFEQRELNMAVLIAVGTTAAYVFSVFLTTQGSQDSYYEAAALLVTFVFFGHWLEMKARRGTTDALQALFNLVPPQARVLRDQREELVPTSEVKIGDIIILKPGDRIPTDGIIIEGETSIDESLVTGESIPVAKKAGDHVIGGSVNQSGSVKVEATKVGEETALAQIVKLVETAQNSKAPGQRLADRFAKYLVILAVGTGIVTLLTWYLIFRQPLQFA